MIERLIKMIAANEIAIMLNYQCKSIDITKYQNIGNINGNNGNNGNNVNNVNNIMQNTIALMRDME
jgi:hypothetical protein